MILDLIYEDRNGDLQLVGQNGEKQRVNRKYDPFTEVLDVKQEYADSSSNEHVSDGKEGARRIQGRSEFTR